MSERNDTDEELTRKLMAVLQLLQWQTASALILRLRLKLEQSPSQIASVRNLRKRQMVRDGKVGHLRRTCAATLTPQDTIKHACCKPTEKVLSAAHAPSRISRGMHSAQ